MKPSLKFLMTACLVLVTAVAYPQSGDVVISSDTSWPAGTYNLTSLQVTNGATLTLQSAKTTSQVDGTWAGYGVTINALTVQVDAGSKISADGQGYTGGATGAAGNGPGGGGGSYLYDAAGGSFGGLGYSSPTLNAGPIYGSALTPTDLGSGGGGTTIAAGGSNYGPHVGGDGGGAIRLIVTGSLILNGTVSANGRAGAPNWPPSLDNYAGGGSGGSIYVTAYALSGSGFFQANGGPRYWEEQPTSPSGGGGRIAVYYEDASAFTGFNSSTANGAPGAQQGTVGFFNTTSNDLLVTGAQKFAYPEDSSISLNGVTIRGGATLIMGGGSSLTAESDILVTENSKLVLQGKNTSAQVEGTWAGIGVSVTAQNVQVDAGSSINADGTGYTGTPPPQTGNGPGGGGGTVVYDSTGGSYGGLGASWGSAVGPTYGSETNPTDLGSGGGGASNSIGGNGGGAIRLVISNSIINNGIISANGSEGGTYAGGGSGGSIWATVASMSGTGIISANGATRAGGGRIAIYHTDDIAYGSVQANGGVGGAQAGTIYVKTVLHVAVGTSPPGLSYSVDGNTFTSLQFFDWEEGSEHTLATTSPQAATGMQSVFDHWSDGGAMSHTVTATLGQTSYAAMFATQYQLTTGVWPEGAGTVTPTSGNFYPYYTTVNVSATPSAGYVFERWNGPVANINSPTTTVTMTGALTITAVFTSSTVPVTIRTIPAGLSFTVDGETYSSEQTFSWSAGATHTISTSSPQAGGSGTRYVFDTWSDLGAMSHTITVPITSTTYTAQFITQNQLTIAVSPPAAGSVSANPTSADGYYSAGATVQLTAAPNTGYTFTNWSGDLTGSTNPQTITINAARNITANFTAGTVPITVNTNPIGRSFTVDGTNYTSEQTFWWVVGSSHEIAATSLQVGTSGLRYVFSNWSDGGALTHTITVAGAATYTANFTTQYQLAMAASPANGGTVTASPDSADGFYNSGTSVQLTASPNSGYAFTNWSGAITGNTNPQTVSMSEPRSVTAHFTATVTVTVATNPAGRSFKIDGNLYSSTQTFNWVVGEVHDIGTSSPQAGATGTQYVFANWSDGGAMSHAVTVSAGTTSYTANFTTQYQLTTGVSPANGGTVTPLSGNFYDPGTVVNVEATPASNYVFDHWTGNVANANASGTTVTMSAPQTVTAYFLATVQVTIGTNPGGRNFSVDGTTYATAQAFTWTVGSQHLISTISPQAGVAGVRYAFSNWSDGGAISHTITVAAGTTTYTANFTTQYQLITVASPSGSGSISTSPSSGDGYFDNGTVVQLTASPNTGFTFSSWSGDLAGTANPQTLTMASAHSVTANFSAVSPDFQFAASGSSSDSVKAGKRAEYNLVVTGIAGFSGIVNFTCSGLPELTSCTFAPAQVTISGTAPVPVSLAIATTAERHGKNASPGTPAGTYTITATSAGVGILHSVPLTLTVK